MGQNKPENNVKSEGHKLEWQQIFDALPDLIAVIDLDHKITRVNKSMADKLGVKPDELVGKHCFSLMHGSENPPDFCPHSRLIEDLKYHENEFPIESLQGDYLVSVSPILDDEGELTGSVHIAHDITERKKLGKLNRYLASIVESADDAIIGKELDGRVVSWNRAAENMFGYSRDEILGKNISTIVPGYMLEDYKDIMDQIRAGKSVKHHDTVRMRKDGTQVDVSLHISPMYDFEGVLSGYSTIAHDITERKKMEKILRESEEKYREVFNNANDMISLSIINEDGQPGNFVDVNKIGEERYGYTRSEFLNMTPADIVAPDQLNLISVNAKKIMENQHVEFELDHITKDGKRFPVELNMHTVVINGKKLTLAVVRDISERKKAEEDLKKSEMKYRTIFENVQDVFYRTDSYGIVTEISPSIARYSGFKPSELIGRPVLDVYLNNEDRTKLIQYITDHGEAVDYELELKTKENKILYISTNAHFLYDSNKSIVGIEGSLRDISERKQVEIQLKKSLQEKEMLLKEIHHRVKNNLMIISSLLSLQSSYIEDKASKNIFKESQNRARSMALIHEKLYQSTDLKRIDFGDYIKILSNELFYTYAVNASHVNLNYNVEDIYLDINTAIPLGLIANELITNSLKYAFPDGRDGYINVNFQLINDEYVFSIEDNGVGFPEDVDYKNTESLGLQLVNNLTDQIDGSIELIKDNGTMFKIRFKGIKI